MGIFDNESLFKDFIIRGWGGASFLFVVSGNECFIMIIIVIVIIKNKNICLIAILLRSFS